MGHINVNLQIFAGHLPQYNGSCKDVFYLVTMHERAIVNIFVPFLTDQHLRSYQQQPPIMIWKRNGCRQDWPHILNLPGWCWAEIQQFALVGSSSSLHSEACNALGASDGVIHSRISQEVICF